MGLASEDHDFDKQTAHFNAYAGSSRALARANYSRQLCILSTFGLIILIAAPPEPQHFAIILPQVLHADDKLVRLWKGLSDARPSWKLLQDQRSTSAEDNPILLMASPSLLRPTRTSAWNATIHSLTDTWKHILLSALAACKGTVHLCNIWRAGILYKSQGGVIPQAQVVRRKPDNGLIPDLEAGGSYGTMEFSVPHTRFNQERF